MPIVHELLIYAICIGSLPGSQGEVTDELRRGATDLDWTFPGIHA